MIWAGTARLIKGTMCLFCSCVPEGIFKKYTLKLLKVKEFILTVGKHGKKELTGTTDNFKRTALHLVVKEGFDVLA